VFPGKTCCCCSVGGSLAAKPWILLGLGLLVLLVAGACATGPAPDGRPEGSTAGATSMAYTVRGELVSLPDADDAMSSLRIEHEAIPDMVGHDGKVSGMDSMTMPFSTREGLSLDGLSVGDKVEFDLNIDWDRTPALLVTEIHQLAADTELTLGHDHGG